MKLAWLISGKACLYPTAEQEEEQTSCAGKTLQPEKASVSPEYRSLECNNCWSGMMHTDPDPDTVLYFQEASSEPEVVNIDGRTADALTVCTCVQILIYIH